VDGVILTTVAVDSDVPDYLSKRGLPCALAVRRAKDACVDTVVSDNLTAGEIAVRHLVDLGHRDIAAVMGPSNLSTAQEREEGLTRCLRSGGRKIRQKN